MVSQCVEVTTGLQRCVNRPFWSACDEDAKGKVVRQTLRDGGEQLCLGVLERESEPELLGGSLGMGMGWE